MAPKGEATRPTPDRLRESLFSSIAPQLEGVPFADFYAGSGAVGIEALSRGASSVTFVEHDRLALEALRANLKSLGIEKRTNVIAKKVRAALSRPFPGIVFVDPPYEAEAEYLNCLQYFGENPPDLLLMQHDRRLVLPEKSGKLELKRQLKQADNWISFYFCAAGADGMP